MTLDVVEGSFAIARLEPDAPIPVWANGVGFVSVTRTAAELSIVCETQRMPQGIRHEAGWSCLRLKGPLEFALVGVLESIARPLALAKVPIFSISTFDTDYVLVPAVDLQRAIGALRIAGHHVAP